MTIRSFCLSLQILSCYAVLSTSASFGQFGHGGGLAEPTKPNATAPRVHSFPLATENEARIERVLDAPANVELTDDVELEKVLRELEKQFDIDIWLDKQAISDGGHDIDQKITLAVKRISLRSCLKLILEPLGLTTVIEDDVLKITTKAALANHITTRIYPIADLCATKDDATELLQTLECGLGKPENGEPKYHLVVSARLKSLTVRESYVVHQQVQALLNALRDLRTTDPIPLEADPFEAPAPSNGGLKPIPPDPHKSKI
ncbi:MAG: hypothetical protein WCJ09_10790 [Planctomycetota bacterium]